MLSRISPTPECTPLPFSCCQPSQPGLGGAPRGLRAAHVTTEVTAVPVPGTEPGTLHLARAVRSAALGMPSPQPARLPCTWISEDRATSWRCGRHQAKSAVTLGPSTLGHPRPQVAHPKDRPGGGSLHCSSLSVPRRPRKLHTPHTGTVPSGNTACDSSTAQGNSKLLLSVDGEQLGDL